MNTDHTHRYSCMGSTLRRATLGAAAVLVGFGSLVGCTSEQAYSDIHEENRALNERVQQLSSENVQYQAASGAQQQEMMRQEQTISELQQSNLQLTGQLSGLDSQLNAIDERIMNTQVSMLDPSTDRALRQLGLSYPNLLSYDSDTGMIRFTSDLTFGSGSDVVKQSAVQALQTLARVLQTEASMYDVQVVGHTDSQRISSKSAKNHPTNRHLSCHRAISVANALKAAGVPQTRIMAGGWGEFRPLVPNAPNGNTQQNRRVEIFLKTSSSGSSYSNVNIPAASPVYSPVVQPAPTRIPDEIIK